MKDPTDRHYAFALDDDEDERCWQDGEMTEHRMGPLR